jgi:hypothetical protein
MNCPKCNRENNDHAQACFYCHSPLSEVPAARPRPDVRFSRLAVASVVFGLLGLPCFFIYYGAATLRYIPPAPIFGILFLISAILAILLGIAALVRIETNYGRLTGRVFAATGIALPVVSVFFVTFLIALNRPRCVAYRLYCGTNLSGIGKAMLIYAGDYDGELPHAGGPNSKWGSTPNWQADTAAEAYGLDDGSGQASISANFYLLLKYGEVTPKSFLCRGDAGTVQYTNAAVDLADLWDFGPDPSKHCSYTYHIPYGEYPLTTSSAPGLAVAADRNPWLPTPGRSARSMKDFQAFDPNGTRESIKRGNAVEHKEEGQNILFADGHTNFEKTSACGLNEDNIYTSQNAADITKGVLPTTTSQPANKTDSLLLHDPPKGANK